MDAKLGPVSSLPCKSLEEFLLFSHGKALSGEAEEMRVSCEGKVPRDHTDSKAREWASDFRLSAPAAH